MAKAKQETPPPAGAGIDRALLLALVDTLVPPGGGEGAMPAASELAEFRDMPAGEARLVYGPLLDLLLADHPAEGAAGFASQGLQTRESVVRALQAEHPDTVGSAVAQTLIRYYGAGAAAQALGLEARPPHPRGYALAETNWALLEPVRKRDRIYKASPGQGEGEKP